MYVPLKNTQDNTPAGRVNLPADFLDIKRRAHTRKMWLWRNPIEKLSRDASLGVSFSHFPPPIIVSREKIGTRGVHYLITMRVALYQVCTVDGTRYI